MNELRYDIPRLRKAVEHAETHPEEFDMRFWVAREGTEQHCRTIACLAGTIVIQADGMEAVSDWEEPWGVDAEALREDGWLVAGSVGSGEEWTAIRARAARLIGLDPVRDEPLVGALFLYNSTTEAQRRVTSSNIRQHVETVLGVTL